MQLTRFAMNLFIGMSLKTAPLGKEIALPTQHQIRFAS